MNQTYNEDSYRDDMLVLARQLVARLESGDESGASEMVDAIARMHKSSLFQQVGMLTRQLHESLSSCFTLEPKVMTLIDKEIPNARDCLDHVIALTQQSADQTLTSVEVSIPLIDEISSEAKALKMRLGDSVTELPGSEATKLIENTIKNGELIRKNLSEIMQAQEFQDLTGQVIQRVIKLIQEVEVNLVSLIRVFSEKSQVSEDEKVERGSQHTGPVVPGVDDTNSVINQNEIDQLLASMGF